MQLINSLTFIIGFLLFSTSYSQDTQITLRDVVSDQKPLIVLDGKIWDNNRTFTNTTDLQNKMSPITEINPDEIEHVTVLKGEEAFNLYGELAQNGVIIINRKKRWLRNKP